MERASWFANDQSGYFREHATRPQTIGYPLADSAAGQALWIYEKFQAWTDNHGNPEDALAVDAMLDNISLYWFTDTAASSARIYWENTRAGLVGFSGGGSSCPWRRRSSRARSSARRRPGPRRCGPTCSIGMSEEERLALERSADGLQAVVAGFQGLKA